MPTLWGRPASNPIKLEEQCSKVEGGMPVKKDEETRRKRFFFLFFFWTLRPKSFGKKTRLHSYIY